MNRLEAMGYVSLERDRQDEKWGTGRELPAETWLTIITEEVGECARAILENKPVDLKAEVTQVAATALAWLESFPNGHQRT